MEDLCYSLQETSFSMIGEVTERAIAHTQCEELLLTGGVAQNLHLQKMLKQICKEHGTDFAAVPSNLAGDNGAMIAWTGVLMHKYNDHLKLDESRVKPRWRIDQVDVSWMK
jgi:tRNA A37 threonylcarbamoyltransferase TsaD